MVVQVVSAVVNFTSSNGRYYSVLIVARVARESCVLVVFSGRDRLSTRRLDTVSTEHKQPDTDRFDTR